MNASNKVFLDDAAMMAKLDAMGGTAPVMASDDEHRAKIDAIRAKHVAAMKAYQDMHEAVMAQLDAMQVATEAYFAAKRVAA